MNSFIKWMKTWVTVERKIFETRVSEKGVRSRIYKELSKLNSKTPDHPMRKWTKDMKGHYPEEDIQTVKKHTKRCSTLLPITELKLLWVQVFGRTWGFIPYLSGQPTVITPETAMDAKKLHHSYVTSGNVKQYGYSEKEPEGFLQK